MATARQNAEQGAEDGAAHDRRRDAAQVIPARHQTADLPHRHVAVVLVLEIAQDLGDAEHADRDRDEIEPIGEFELAKREPRRARVNVGADQPQEEPEHDHRERLHHRAVGERYRRDQAQHHQRKVFRGAELEGDLGQGRREQYEHEVATEPAKNEPSAAVASAGPARPCRAIW